MEDKNGENYEHLLDEASHWSLLAGSSLNEKTGIVRV